MVRGYEKQLKHQPLTVTSTIFVQSLDMLSITKRIKRTQWIDSLILQETDAVEKLSLTDDERKRLSSSI